VRIRGFEGFGQGLLFAGALALAASPADAQFGGMFSRKSKSSDSSSTQQGCDESKPNVGRSILGGVLGGITSRATSRMGVAGSFVPSAEVAGILTDAIACKLDPDEQKQAADATLEATRGEEVGSTSEWTSNTRQDVSGRSTVTEKTALADGTNCMNVTDVIIVEGEETTVQKKMCRGPGQARYTLAA